MTIGTCPVPHRAERDSLIEDRVLRNVMLDPKTLDPKTVGLKMLGRTMLGRTMLGRTMLDRTMRGGRTMHLLLNLEHPIQTIAVLPRRAVRLLSRTIVRHHLRTGPPLHQKIGIKPHLPKPGRLRPHGLSHDQHLRLKISLGLRQDPPTTSSRIARHGPRTVVAETMTAEGTKITTTEITTTKITTTKTGTNLGNETAKQEFKPDLGQAFSYSDSLRVSSATPVQGYTGNVVCRFVSYSSVF
jgi:hypothetical protein